jgi:hypothetical protein
MGNGAWIGALRVGAALTIAMALGVQASADLAHGTFTWDQLPGFFTPLAALTGMIALVAAALTRGLEPRWVSLLRVNAATYLLAAGLVYWAVLAPHANPLHPWANVVLHGGAGAVLTLDWLLLGGRRWPPASSWWTVTVVPGGWLAYLGVRAVTDGWLPYPFLDPSRGVATVIVTLVTLVGAGIAVAGLLRWCARWTRLDSPGSSHSRQATDASTAAIRA